MRPFTVLSDVPVNLGGVVFVDTRQKVGYLACLEISTRKDSLSKRQYPHQKTTLTQFKAMDRQNSIGNQNKTFLALATDETASFISRLHSSQEQHSCFEGWQEAGEFPMVLVETPNMSEITWIHRSNNFVQDSVISLHSRIFPSFP
uniref:Uncharacterized protein n=1 Tax=Salix viminalis TaxID=40686 RepID=A0A6N2MZR6_SALVM